MSTLVHLDKISIGFRGPALFENAECRIRAGERIGLLGRNGAGKSTLLRMLDGQCEPDTGRVHIGAGVKIALLSQDVPTELAGTAAEVVALGFDIEQQAADADSWQVEHRVAAMLERMGIEPDAEVGLMSSGMKRRVLLARTMVNAPDLLLLDEPTNHLDIPAIRWLEEFLVKQRCALLFVTHDRAFLKAIANRILELDRGRLFDWTCDYPTFLKRKEQALEAEEKEHAEFDKKLAAEEVWIRQGIKARRTRNEGRVRALKAMRETRSERRQQTGVSKLEIQEAANSGRLVLSVESISFAHGPRVICQDFTTQIMRGDKVGIIGRNGAGKSTLLKLLLGQLPPDSGLVKTGTNLEIAYFDQLRQQLNPNETVADCVGEGSDSVGTGDRRKHVLGYLQEFLFEPARARTEIRFLSGGEKNRVLLAKLFCKPANLIVMDEPTNDLDQETLELLEQRLVEFSGTILLVSHDREFLNNVVTSTIVFEPDGRLQEYVGGYDDWLRQSGASQPQPEKSNKKPRESNPRSKAGANERQPAAADGPPAGTRKLKFREQKELDELPDRIEQLEAELGQMHQQMADADFYKKPGDEISEFNSKVAQLQEQLDQAYARWEQLEELSS